MTPEEHDLIFSLVVVPGSETIGKPEDVLHYYGTTDGRTLGLDLLRRTCVARAAVDLEAALIVCQTFGFDARHTDLLSDLLSADWHQQHENVVSMLSQLKLPDTTAVLLHAATWIPDYLDWDENRALAKKAIWALGAIPGTEARDALAMLSKEQDETLASEARAQLERHPKGTSNSSTSEA